VVNEYFDTQDPDANSFLIYLERLPIEYRCNIFVTLLTSRFRTMAHMIAFCKSVKTLERIARAYGLIEAVPQEWWCAADQLRSKSLAAVQTSSHPAHHFKRLTSSTAEFLRNKSTNRNKNN
jgi:hypothetical protein